MTDPVEMMPTELLKDTWQTQDQVYPEQWWFTKYWESTDGSHRDAIITALEHVGPFSSVLELGCNTGPNLRRIHQRWPGVALVGLDIHAGALAYGRAAAEADGWAWTGVVGDLRELGRLEQHADVVLSCYSLAYLDPRDIDAALAAALACAKTALIICEPGAGGQEVYVPPGPKNVAEYHYNYLKRLHALPGTVAVVIFPITPPHVRLHTVLTVLKA
jgi:SAM-dependent methyltransferase